MKQESEVDREKWFRDEIEDIHIDKYMVRKSDQDQIFQPLSLLKLIAFSYVLPTYTQIIGKYKNYYPKMIYIDLMSGPGVKAISNRKKGNNLRTASFLGSPLLAIIKAKKPFDFMYFVDIDEDKCKLLEQRINVLGKNKKYQWVIGRYKIINNDVNTAVDQIVKEIRNESCHAFIFADPFHIEIELITLAKILHATRSDIFINIMTQEALRKVRIGQEKEKLFKWFGGDAWTELKNRDDIRDKYCKKIVNIPDKYGATRDVNDLVPVYADEKIKDDSYYELLYAARETKGGNAWFKVINNIRGKLENTSSDDIFHIINNLYFGHSTLDDFDFTYS
jgi:three-Cys-motif partner protein